MGTWDADLSSLDDEYADTELYIVIDETGHGETYMNGGQSENYSVYAYDNGEKGDGKGICVAGSNDDGEVSHAHYAIEEKDGKTVLTFTSGGEVISWIKRS